MGKYFREPHTALNAPKQRREYEPTREDKKEDLNLLGATELQKCLLDTFDLQKKVIGRQEEVIGLQKELINRQRKWLVSYIDKKKKIADLIDAYDTNDLYNKEYEPATADDLIGYIADEVQKTIADD